MIDLKVCRPLIAGNLCPRAVNLEVPMVEDLVANEVALREAPRSSGGGFAVPAFVDE